MEVMVFFKQPDRLHLQSKGFAMLPREGLLINPNRFSKENFYVSAPKRETVEGVETFKLELAPKTEEIKLRRIVLWVDTVRWIIISAKTVTWQGQWFKIGFEYEKFQEKYWLPASALVTVDMKGFKGFSSFHDMHAWKSDNDEQESTGRITIEFLDYRINQGIPDSIFGQEME